MQVQKKLIRAFCHCSNLVAKNTYFVGCFKLLSCEVFSWHEFSCMRFVLDVSLVLRVSSWLAVKCQVYSRLNIGALGGFESHPLLNVSSLN